MDNHLLIGGGERYGKRENTHISKQCRCHKKHEYNKCDLVKLFSFKPITNEKRGNNQINSTQRQDWIHRTFTILGLKVSSPGTKEKIISHHVRSIKKSL